MNAILCEASMIVDDRLETVLRTVAAGRGAIRTQLRQLVDLVGRTLPAGWTRTHDAALGRIDALKIALGDAPSAALISTCTLRSPRLVQHFAAGSPKVALAAIVNAQLSEAEWRSLIPGLPVQARGFLRHRRDLGPKVEALLARFGITDFALPLPAGYETLVLATPAPEPLAPVQAPTQPAAPSAPPALAGEGISAIIQRIEAFRSARDAQAMQSAALTGAGEGMGQTRLPFAEEPLPAPPPLTAIDLQLDAAGTIIAADAAQAPALVGLKPFSADLDAPASCDPSTIRAGRARLPIACGLFAIEGTGPVAGAWRIDAVPLFSADTGHFLGHHARLRRPVAPAAAAPSGDPANDDEAGGSVDRLRQLLHELRTPINAIQGYAELIQQQIMGPTPHQYRSLAAGIASDAAHMLAGFEDIERLVGLESGLATGKARARIDPAEGTTELTGLLVRLVGQLEPVLAPREVKLRADLPDTPLHVAVTPLELERSLWRLLSLIASTAAPGERLALALRTATGPKGEEAQLALPLPATLAMRDDAALMAPDSASATPSGGALLSSGGAMLGSGFVLRLAAAEIRAANGRFTRDGARLSVTLPLLTAAQQKLSHA